MFNQFHPQLTRNNPQNSRKTPQTPANPEKKENR